jgi:hypothetical protein
VERNVASIEGLVPAPGGATPRLADQPMIRVLAPSVCATVIEDRIPTRTDGCGGRDSRLRREKRKLCLAHDGLGPTWNGSVGCSAAPGGRVERWHPFTVAGPSVRPAKPNRTGHRLWILERRWGSRIRAKGIYRDPAQPSPPCQSEWSEVDLHDLGRPGSMNHTRLPLAVSIRTGLPRTVRQRAGQAAQKAHRTSLADAFACETVVSRCRY